MMTCKTPVKNERGISLLIVLLIGSIILLTSIATGEYALRTVKSLRARGDATQALYNAEQTFECVKYWINENMLNFTDQSNDDIVCNGTTFNFFTGTNGATFVGSEGKGSFSIPTDPTNPGGSVVKVEVINPSISAHHFFGTIKIYSQTGSSLSTSERYQEYEYNIREGADVMFVLDRSGSIDRLPAGTSEWDAMVNSVVGAILELDNKLPRPHVGLLSFGRNTTDVGNWDGSSMVVPDVPLTDTYSNLVNAFGTLNMRTTVSYTNLSLGISIAGAELMGKAYPFTGTTNTPPADGEDTGGFEWIVAEDGDFDDLPNSATPAMDRDDSEFPDVIVVVSDGAPNAIMTHALPVLPQEWYASEVTSSNVYKSPILTHDYLIGEEKLFRTDVAGDGLLIVDSGGPPSPNPTDVPIANRYNWCNDKLDTEPNDVLNNPVNGNTFPHFAMCNATLIAKKLQKDPPRTGHKPITFIVVYVGSDESAEEAVWLKKHLASPDPAIPGEFLFQQVADFDHVKDAIMEQFMKLTFLQNL